MAVPLGIPSSAPGVSILAGAFRHTTNSYKHLFFRTLLSVVAVGRAEIALEKIAAGMMQEAWWPGFHYRLSLGARDMVVSRIEAAVDVDGLRRDPNAVRDAIEGAVKGPSDPLLRFVPQRFLRPWFVAETRGIPDHRVDKEIVRLSQRPNNAAPYRIERDRLVVSPPWMDFFERNLAFVQGWSDANWIEYLEARNPGVPGLARKIAPALDRPSLADQAALWRAAMAQDKVHCIYSGAALSPSHIAIDHFIPRSFVSHDRIWNLTPTHLRLNLEKSDHLPDLGFVPALARQHARLARAADRLEGRPAVVWGRVLDEVAADLRIGPDVMRRKDDLASCYHDMLAGLAGIARRMGFPDGWRPAA